MASIETSLKASEERACRPLRGSGREEDGKQLEELRKPKESLGTIAYLCSFQAR
jgi:hypothetical protein